MMPTYRLLEFQIHGGLRQKTQPLCAMFDKMCHDSLHKIHASHCGIHTRLQIYSAVKLI